MNKLGLGHELNISQTLELMLSPRMIQMLKILNVPYAELIEEIEKETEENVMLEMERPDRLLEYLKQISTERIPKKEIALEELPGIETLADTSENLEDHLLKQLDTEDLDKKERKIAETLIGNIDPRGYLSNYKDICETLKKELNVSQDKIDGVLETIQGLEPEGVGARDLKECLLIQVREHNFESEELEELLVKAIKDHLDDLAEKKFDRIAKDLNIPKDGAAKLAEFIKNNLYPSPGSIFAETVPCVIPSFSLIKEKDAFKVLNLEKDYGPVLKISSVYEKMLKDPKTDAKSMEFLKAKLEAAKDFLENIAKRHETIEKILDMIIKTQSGYLESEKTQLNPLMQKDIANELGLHPSTISRAVSNKYIQLPRGVVLLKVLCPREVKGITGGKILELLKGVISSEDKKHPLTDDEIAEKLSLEGLRLERRTVASYRKKLGLEAASKRVSARGGSPP
ncbi:MAG: RNA polymerase factor sigma-54 [bacterium]